MGAIELTRLILDNKKKRCSTNFSTQVLAECFIWSAAYRAHKTNSLYTNLPTPNPTPACSASRPEPSNFNLGTAVVLIVVCLSVVPVE